MRGHVLLALLCASRAAALCVDGGTAWCRVAHRASPRASAPVAGLGRILAAAVPTSIGALTALNMAQNGPNRPIAYGAMRLPQDVASAPPSFTGDAGVVISGPFTPTCPAPDNLDDVLTLRTKADVLRAWRNGAAPELPGDELYDGAMIQRGALSPCFSFVTHKLFARGRRWRGLAFEGGRGRNRFGGSRRNRFGITSSDSKELIRLIREQMLEQRARLDPLLSSLMKMQGRDEESSEEEWEERKAALQGSSTAEAEAAPELRCRGFEASISESRLDGQPALVLDYSNGEGVGDAIWGKLLGMRAEVREVVPGVLVGLGSFRATLGVRNCAVFVLVRSEASS